MYTEFQVKREHDTLAGYKWAVDAPKGIVILLHGLGECAAKYDPVAAWFTAAEYAVYAVDLPGHGCSFGKRGHVGCSAEIVKIVDEVINYAKKDCPNVPVFVMGHSMGGNIALSHRCYRRDASDIKGYVSGSPWLSVDNKWLKNHYKTVLFLGFLLPKMTIGEGWCKISFRTAADRERDARLVTEKAGEGKPVYLFNGSKDPLCLPAGAHLFRDRAGVLCTYREWENREHDLLTVDGGKEVAEEIITWLDSMVKS